MNIKKDITLFLLVLMTSQGSALALYNLDDMDRSYMAKADIVKPTLYVYDSAYSYRSEKNVVITGEKSQLMTSNVSGKDPFTGKRYKNVMLGAVNKTKRFFNKDYTHWRYITLFNIEKKDERVGFLPFFHEDCHDDSFFMAEWGESRTLTVKLESQVGAEQLGISASVGMSISQGTTFSTTRRIKAVKGIEAKHYPYSYTETHTGTTYVMVYDQNSGDYDILRPRGFRKFSLAIKGGYPYPYKLDNQNIGFHVKREILQNCEVAPGNANEEENVNDDGREYYNQQNNR